MIEANFKRSPLSQELRFLEKNWFSFKPPKNQGCDSKGLHLKAPNSVYFDIGIRKLDMVIRQYSDAVLSL